MRLHKIFRLEPFQVGNMRVFQLDGSKIIVAVTNFCRGPAKSKRACSAVKGLLRCGYRSLVIGSKTQPQNFSLYRHDGGVVARLLISKNVNTPATLNIISNSVQRQQYFLGALAVLAIKGRFRRLFGCLRCEKMGTFLVYEGCRSIVESFSITG